MGLPVIQETEEINPRGCVGTETGTELREVPGEVLVERLKSNVKTPRSEGISNLGKPEWLKIRPPSPKYAHLKQRLRAMGLVTVCQESHCPNMSECWSGGTATFMVLGDTCTRACRFCAVKSQGKPPLPDPEESRKLVEAVKEMGSGYVVITAVDRDDLPDGGAAHFAECVRALKQDNPRLLVEVLSGDFQGDEKAVAEVVNAGVDVFAHNLETVRRLQSAVRDRRASYEQSLSVLRAAKKINPSVKTKTSLMVGFGEEHEELLEAIRDARAARVDIITFGQYLQPTSWHVAVARYYSPEEFKRLEQISREEGFLYCAAGPFVRSSYRAAELFTRGLIEKEEIEKREKERSQSLKEKQGRALEVDV